MSMRTLLRSFARDGTRDSEGELQKLRRRLAGLESKNAELRRRLATVTGAEQFKHRYVGKMAKDYDAKRSRSIMWKREHAFVERHLATLVKGSTVLDLPVGTGRYVPLYAAMGLRATGLDSSDDMLAEAAKKARACACPIELANADALDPPCMDGSFDAVLCIRMLNFFRDDELTVVLDHLVRISRSLILFTLRVDHAIEKPIVANSKHTIVHPIKTLDDFIVRHRLEVVERLVVDQGDSGQNFACALRK